MTANVATSSYYTAKSQKKSVESFKWVKCALPSPGPVQEGFEYLRILLTLDNFVCSIPFMHTMQYDNITAAHFPEWFLFALSNPTLQLCDTCIGIATC